MAMGSSLVGGYRQGQAANQERSYMPVINTLGNMIRSRRAEAARGGGRRFVMSSGESGLDRRSREREARHQLEEAKEEEKYRFEMNRRRQEQLDAEASRLRSAQDERAQEAHESNLERSQFELERGRVKAGREDKLSARKDAYDALKAGLMMRDADIMRAAYSKLMPAGEDQISYETLPDGTRKVTARPAEQEVPEFIFHPDGYVGVQFPGEEKPVVFKDADEAFKTVIAPMNPDKWEGTDAKDRVQAARYEAEADYKNRKLQADIHADAHEAALKQFEADGYFQPALYDEEKYWKSYNDYVRRATGSEPTVKQGDQGAQDSGETAKGTPKQYTGDEPPQGFPNAKRGPRGGWYVQQKGKWYPILEGKEQAPATPRRKSMPGQRTAEADNAEMQASGVSVRSQPKNKRVKYNKKQMAAIREGGGIRKEFFDRKGKKISKEPDEGELYRGTAPPKNYPDAQFDRDKGIWYYFDSDSETWKEVRI